MYFAENLEFLLEESPHHGIGGIDAERLNAFIAGTADPKPSELLIIADYFNLPLDRLLRRKLSEIYPAGSIRLVVFDVDGVLTDAGMYYTESGDEFKKFNSKDGLAIRRLAKAGYITGIISHGINRNLIERRAALLNISRVYAGDRPKEEVLLEWCKELDISPLSAAYIGDDVNDLPVMRIAGFTACPADAVDAVKNEVEVVLQKKGGEGCVREWIDQYFIF